MSRGPFPYQSRQPQPLDYSATGQVSVGAFFNSVYAWMCTGLAVTTIVAWMVAGNPQTLRSIFQGGTFFVLIVVELILVMVISSAINRIGAGMATVLFLIYAALNGATLSVIFLVYNMGTIGAAFVTTAGMFGAMSLIGYTTKKDLSGLGSLLMMGLIGIIIASIVNLFVANSTLDWVITYAGVVVFLGLTAYDTQRLKAMAYATAENPALSSRMAIVGSLVLYLDFINLFLFILKILGKARR